MTTTQPALPILLTADEHIPLYLQLVHQFRHLITSRQLASDAQLPSVRELSQQLNVNSGTVAMAYRTLQHEGLIESRRGRGSFVAPVPDEATRFDARQSALMESIDVLIGRASALGFDGSTTRHYLSTRMQQETRSMPIVVIMPSTQTAAKYAPLIATALPVRVNAAATLASMAQLEAGDEDLLRAYESSYFTFTFLSLAPKVEAALAKRGISSEVVGVGAQLTEATKERLRNLPADGRYCLLGESRNVSSAVNLVAQYSPIDVRRLPVITELNAKGDIPDVSSMTVIYSFGSLRLLDELAVPTAARLQLEFTLSDESRERLRTMLDPRLRTGSVEMPVEIAFEN